MIKRSTAFFYILFTSFILLAHAVIPHHYHKSEIFIVNSDCQSDNGVHKHGTTEHSHDDHDEANAENCIIKQVVIVRSNQETHELKSLESPDNHKQIIGFKAHLINNSISVSFPVLLSNVPASLLFSSYLSFVSTGLGLRAPPKIV